MEEEKRYRTHPWFKAKVLRLGFVVQKSDFMTQGHLPFTHDKKIEFYIYKSRLQIWGPQAWKSKCCPMRPGECNHHVRDCTDTLFARGMLIVFTHFHTYLGVKTMECKWPYLNTISTSHLCITIIDEHKQTWWCITITHVNHLQKWLQTNLAPKSGIHGLVIQTYWTHDTALDECHKYNLRWKIFP